MKESSELGGRPDFSLLPSETEYNRERSEIYRCVQKWTEIDVTAKNYRLRSKFYEILVLINAFTVSHIDRAILFFSCCHI